MVLLHVNVMVKVSEINAHIAFMIRKSQNLLENVTFSSPTTMAESLYFKTINIIPKLFLKWQLQRQRIANL